VLSLVRRSSGRRLGVRHRLLLSALPRAPLGCRPALGQPLLGVRDSVRERTVLDRKRAAARRARRTALGARAAEGEGKGKGDAVPHDDPEPLAARMPAHPSTHARAEPGPPRPRRGYPEEFVDRQYRGLHGPQGPAQAHAPLRCADCPAANLLVMVMS
jgi:hypothetical protein